MKNFRRIFSLCLCLLLTLTCAATVFAAESKDAIIDETKTASLTIYKYDYTSAMKDGVWNEDSFISTGWRESYVESTLGSAVRDGDTNGNPDNSLGNGQNANGYALRGVEYTILRVADIGEMAIKDSENNISINAVLYGFDKEKSADFLAAIGLPDGTDAFVDDTLQFEQYSPDSNMWYYPSDVLIDSLSAALEEDSTAVKNALEAYIATGEDAIVMDKTDENGKTSKDGLELGLYLVVETAVPEMVTSTTNPFLVSLPMTTVSGNENSESVEGGHAWNYAVTIYPKNNTGIPSLEKTVREAMGDTGNNKGTDSITDGYAHTATASGGDTLEYQILSTLPSITSDATGLTTYNFYDTIAAGLSYNKDLRDVKITIYSDPYCTSKVAEWDMDSGKFTVSYSEDNRHMTVDITETGLAEINADIPNINGKLFRGYSNHTVKVTYTATVNSDASIVTGDNGNCNEVVLTWKRSSTDYYDTLIDDCHVFAFGVDLIKEFNDKENTEAHDAGMYDHVKFMIYNDSDDYWVTATRDEATGIYYVTGHAAQEAEATVFTPVMVNEVPGHILIQGMEPDSYSITEIETANGYTLLQDDIDVVITAEEDTIRPCDIYAKDTLGVLQNDPHYLQNILDSESYTDAEKLELIYAGYSQKYLAHNLLTAKATVDENEIVMANAGESANAIVQMGVINTRGFDLPQTGDNGTWMFSVGGILLMAGAVALMFIFLQKKEEKQSSHR